VRGRKFGHASRLRAVAPWHRGTDSSPLTKSHRDPKLLVYITITGCTCGVCTGTNDVKYLTLYKHLPTLNVERGEFGEGSLARGVWRGEFGEGSLARGVWRGEFGEGSLGRGEFGEGRYSSGLRSAVDRTKASKTLVEYRIV
jgi:hypothetical protein